MATDSPKITIVVASHNARRSVEECLSTLTAQAKARPAEILVVDNSTDGTTEIIRERFPELTLICEPPHRLIPELWTVGICQSQGAIVAITTAHFVPRDNWLEETLRAHEAPVSAVGGAIENHVSSGVVDWAVYFCRYARYMLPFQEFATTDLAGDNASYNRADLELCRAVWQDGFWEPSVHAQLAKEGRKLILTPSIVAYHKQSFDAGSFLKNRFQHGQKFGRERAARLGLGRRLAYVLMSPVIPLLFLVRIARQVNSRQKHRADLVKSLPFLTLFLVAWALGETTGYLRGASQ